MSSDDRSLRSILSWGTLALTGSALAATLAVVGLTTLLHRATSAVETSAQGVRAAVESKVDLLLHAQATSPIVKRDLAGNLQRRLMYADTYVGSDRERVLLNEAEARVNEYVRAVHGAVRPSRDDVDALHAAAYAALDALANINVAQASSEARQAARVDYAANIGGLTLALLVLAVAAIFIYWLRGPLVRPVLDLGQAMTRFGQGDHRIRAQTSGPRELKEMAGRFNEMAAQIEGQRERQRAFLAGVAHDLRNPVNVLLLSAEAARADVSLPPDHRVRRTLERNARQLRKLDRMISDFLDAAGIEAGQLDLRFEVCDVRDAVRSTAELFEGTSSRHELILHLPADPVRAKLDPLRMEQVITNLVSNAIKYSPDRDTVEINLETSGDEFMLAVTDHGVGISPEEQARLYEPFRRGLSREGIPGVGLGLFVVRRIVEAHHGRIVVESSPGEGSTFRIFMPC